MVVTLESKYNKYQAVLPTKKGWVPSKTLETCRTQKFQHQKNLHQNGFP